MMTKQVKSKNRGRAGRPTDKTRKRRRALRLAAIIDRARRTGRIRDGLVLCDNCDTPASRNYSLALSWTGCAPCVTGEAASLDYADFISVS